MTRAASALLTLLATCPAAAAGPRIVVVHADEPDAPTELGVRSLDLKLRAVDASGARSFEIDAALEGDRHLTLTGRTNPLPDRQFPVSDGQVVLRGGELSRLSLLPAVWNALVDRIPLVPIPRVPTSVGHPSLLQELRASFVVRDGALHTEDLAVVTDDWHARGGGWVALDGRLDVRNEVTLTQQGIERMLVMATLRVPKTGLRSLPGIPVRIGGTLGDPEIQVDAARVPLAPLHILFGIGRALPGLLLPGRGKPD